MRNREMKQASGRTYHIIQFPISFSPLYHYFYPTMSINKKWVPLLLVIMLAIAVILLKRCEAEKGGKDRLPSGPDAPAVKKINRDRGFDRRTSFLKYSKHAECRMDCRKISRKEVEEIMREGTINYKKSDVKNARCPRYAVEGRTSDAQSVRIVYAQCNESTTVVTVIDLETDFACHCPGDDGASSNGKR